MAKNRKVKSKYLGMNFGPWVVVRASKTDDGRHLRFVLARKTHDGATKMVALRDNELKALADGRKTVASLLKGKQFQRDHFPSRRYRNTVWYSFKTNGSLK